MSSSPDIRFVFFGSSRLSVIVLDQLLAQHIKPVAVVTTPDKQQGRKLVLTPNVVKQWGTEHGVTVYDFAKLDAVAQEKLAAEQADVFIVASYGKIIPEKVLDIPAHKTLNIHPSLLPQYRGPSPLPTAMLDDTRQTGVTIMRLDREMDHGPIVAAEPITVTEWPTYEDFETLMARKGGDLLARILPQWVAGTIAEKEQDHSRATFTRKITKEDALIDLAADPYLNFRKIQAYHEWPQAFFMFDHAGKQIRVKITEASFSDGKLEIRKVIPEGKKEMSYADFLSGFSQKK